jgi:hypothetical protein
MICFLHVFEMYINLTKPFNIYYHHQIDPLLEREDQCFFLVLLCVLVVCRERKKMNVIGTQPTHVLIVSRLLQGERRSFVFYPVEEVVRPCSRERVMYILVHWFSFFWGQISITWWHNQKICICNIYLVRVLQRIFCGKKCAKSCQILRESSLRLSYRETVS